jgi:hypothetical protein
VAAEACGADVQRGHGIFRSAVWWVELKHASRVVAVISQIGESATAILDAPRAGSQSEPAAPGPSGSSRAAAFERGNPGIIL